MPHEHISTPELITRLLSPQREEDLDPFVVLTFMPLDSYAQVADIGCGPGYFSIPLAKNLINGQVYALDVDDEMLEVARRRVAEARLGNVQVLKCSPTQFPVSAGSLDGVLLSVVTHESEDRESFLKAVRELLKPRGWCTILEWYRRDTGMGPPLEERIEPEELEEMAQRAGFQFRGWRDLNGKHYMATLSR